MTKPFETPEDDSDMLVFIDGKKPPYIRLTDNVQMVEVDEREGTVTVHGESPKRIISGPDGLATWFNDAGGFHVPTGPAYIEAATLAGIPVVYV